MAIQKNDMRLGGEGYEKYYTKSTSKNPLSKALESLIVKWTRLWNSRDHGWVNNKYQLKKLNHEINVLVGQVKAEKASLHVDESQKTSDTDVGRLTEDVKVLASAVKEAKEIIGVLRKAKANKKEIGKAETSLKQLESALTLFTELKEKQSRAASSSQASPSPSSSTLHHRVTPSPTSGKGSEGRDVKGDLPMPSTQAKVTQAKVTQARDRVETPPPSKTEPKTEPRTENIGPPRRPIQTFPPSIPVPIHSVASTSTDIPKAQDASSSPKNIEQLQVPSTEENLAPQAALEHEVAFSEEVIKQFNQKDKDISDYIDRLAKLIRRNPINKEVLVKQLEKLILLDAFHEDAYSVMGDLSKEFYDGLKALDNDFVKGFVGRFEKFISASMEDRIKMDYEQLMNDSVMLDLLHEVDKTVKTFDLSMIPSGEALAAKLVAFKEDVSRGVEALTKQKFEEYVRPTRRKKSEQGKSKQRAFSKSTVQTPSSTDIPKAQDASSSPKNIEQLQVPSTEENLALQAALEHEVKGGAKNEGVVNASGNLPLSGGKFASVVPLPSKEERRELLAEASVSRRKGGVTLKGILVGGALLYGGYKLLDISLRAEMEVPHMYSGFNPHVLADAPHTFTEIDTLPIDTGNYAAWNSPIIPANQKFGPVYEEFGKVYARFKQVNNPEFQEALEDALDNFNTNIETYLWNLNYGNQDTAGADESFIEFVKEMTKEFRDGMITTASEINLLSKHGLDKLGGHVLTPEDRSRIDDAFRRYSDVYAMFKRINDKIIREPGAPATKDFENFQETFSAAEDKYHLSLEEFYSTYIQPDTGLNREGMIEKITGYIQDKFKDFYKSIIQEKGLTKEELITKYTDYIHDQSVAFEREMLDAAEKNGLEDFVGNVRDRWEGTEAPPPPPLKGFMESLLEDIPSVPLPNTSTVKTAMSTMALALLVLLGQNA